MTRRVAVFTTGGTIDKVYFDALSLFQIGDAAAPVVFEAARVHSVSTVRELLRKDSLDLTDEDRALIARAVADCPDRSILITHGTDTMAATALAVRDELGPDDPRTVVLTGALQPARMVVSDATFNLGFAVAAAQLAPPGVHLAMNGQLFDPAASHKDRQAGRFVADQPMDQGSRERRS